MNKRLLAILGSAALLALPAVALADHGIGGHPEGATGATGTTGATGATGEQGSGRPSSPGEQGQQHGRSHRCTKPHTVAFQLHGVYANFDQGTGTLTLSNAKGNRFARTMISSGTASITVGSAKVNFSDLSDTVGNNGVGWDDVTTADKVVVHGRLQVTKHGCPSTGSPTQPTSQRIKVVGPAQHS